MAAALLAVVSPAILAQAPVKVVCNELKQKGNELVIDAVITVDGSRIKSRENLSLTRSWNRLRRRKDCLPSC